VARIERALTNLPPNFKIHIESYLWASETLKHVDKRLAQKGQVSHFQQADQSFAHKLIAQSLEQTSFEGHSLWPPRRN